MLVFHWHIKIWSQNWSASMHRREKLRVSGKLRVVFWLDAV